MTVLI